MSETEAFDSRQRPPRLVVVCGLPGVGKTTVADRVAERTDGRLLRTDVIRKELFSDPDYTDAEGRRVYEALFERARETVRDGRTAVLDGTFKDAGDRERAAALSESVDAEFRLVLVESDEDAVRERMADREGDESDADFAVHSMYRERFDPVAADHLTVDNSDGLDSTRRQVDEQFPADPERVGDPEP